MDVIAFVQLDLKVEKSRQLSCTSLKHSTPKKLLIFTFCFYVSLSTGIRSML